MNEGPHNKKKSVRIAGVRLSRTQQNILKAVCFAISLVSIVVSIWIVSEWAGGRKIGAIEYARLKHARAKEMRRLSLVAEINGDINEARSKNEESAILLQSALKHYKKISDTCPDSRYDNIRTEFNAAQKLQKAIALEQRRLQKTLE